MVSLILRILRIASFFKMVVNRFWEIHPLGELIMDHGSAFGAHRTDEEGGDGKFKEYIENYGTTHTNKSKYERDKHVL